MSLLAKSETGTERKHLVLKSVVPNQYEDAERAKQLSTTGKKSAILVLPAVMPPQRVSYNAFQNNVAKQLAPKGTRRRSA